MVVMPASYRIDWARLHGVLGAQEARLAREEEFAGLFPDCDTGAMPPFGILYDIPVYVDRALTEDSAIIFPAGTHRDTMKSDSTRWRARAGVHQARTARLPIGFLGDSQTRYRRSGAQLVGNVGSVAGWVAKSDAG